uniref:2'-deoxynucleoside 5'-phosphate N-hydrolase 1 n=1 Tax=Geotrypetes seraphini TaxID=260995 RepID=A0A6P8QF88_GEOSA|nr:2'-deoxynucleoside 5'-phosphate N-hydrolase 1 isoform X2 [Geotrypetes seraphini]
MLSPLRSVYNAQIQAFATSPGKIHPEGLPCILDTCDSGEDAAFIRGDKFIHDRDLAWLNQADVVVAEVTQPSLGVGYELGHAVAMKKTVLCLFCSTSGRVLSAMVRGAENGDHFLVRDYQEEEEIEKILEEYFTSHFPTVLHHSQVSASV